MEDKQIYNGLANGDKEAFDEFYASTKETVEKVVSYFLGDDDSASDAMVRAYETALEDIKHSGIPDIPLISWISIEAVRACYPTLESRRNEYWAQTQSLKETAGKVPVLQEITSDETERLNFMVRGEVEDMPDPHRQLLTMSELDGLSFLEISKRLSTSWVMVINRLYQAREVLAKRVKEQLNV